MKTKVFNGSFITPQRLITVARSLLGSAIVGAILLVAFHIHGIRNTTLTFALLLTVLCMAIRWGRAESISASLVSALGFAIYFQEPVGQLSIHSQEGAVAVFGFLITSIVVSQLSLHAQRRAAEAVERQRETERLYTLGQALLGCDRFETAAWVVINQVMPIFGARSSAFYFLLTDEIHRAGADDAGISREQMRDCARTEDTYTDVSQQAVIIPLRFGDQPFGSFGIAGILLSETVIKSIAHLLTVTLARLQAAEDLARKHQEVINQQQVSESLLLNILPAEVAEELRSKGMVAPKYFEDVTIIFTDFVGFTQSAENIPAEDLVDTLNDYFTAFDRICVRYGLEKLKTVGDSYICLSGLPVRNAAHPVDAIMAACEMLREVQNRDRPESGLQWKVRIGIHTGPVVAGVVGINKFAFDIWGDTVNFSSRLEACSEPNRINISAQTYARVKDFFDCEHRGKVVTKDKREYDMYFVKCLLPALLKSSETIPPPAFLRRYNVYFQKTPPAFPGFFTENHGPRMLADAPASEESIRAESASVG